MNLAESLQNNVDRMVQAIATDDGFRILGGDLAGERLSVDSSNLFVRSSDISRWDTIDSTRVGTLTASVDAIRMSPVELSDETIDRIAERVYELIRQRGIE